MTAIDALLAGLFDYAGLYPPASLDLQSAVNNYLDYRRSEHGEGLGRFINNLDRLEELRAIAGDSLEDLKLSVIAAEDADWSNLARHFESGVAIESVEIKCGQPSAIEHIARKIPKTLATYFEVPVNANSRSALEAIQAAGRRAKIRMGGVVPEAIPSVSDVAQMLRNLADLRLPFKATAGLHHPLRSRQSLTYQRQSPSGVMHGFVNLFAALAHLYFGGDVEEAQLLIAEEDLSAWRVDANALHWRGRSWTANQITTIRRDFFISIGSCSFEEPIHDLERLGWL